ncbi:MAG: transglycosylase SLT domain-containing protein [Candidatus Binatia bacterium]|nr:transglycosylase SLT domain-containing protein [Candidatus Binatia bacterium]
MRGWVRAVAVAVAGLVGGPSVVRRALAVTFVWLVPELAWAALPYPPELRPQVEFWKKIFAHYKQTEVVVHDSLVPERIYSVLDFSADAAELQSDVLPTYVQIRVDQEKERIRSLLVRLHQNGGQPSAWSQEERRLAWLFRSDRSEDKFLLAADPKRIRAQRGLREKFAEGIRISGRYLPTMEAIFRAEGLPIELTRLPLVESCFNVRAYSKAGAAGIWQFMPETGRRFMRVDDLVDERRDPVESTKAAAKFLKQNYAKLGTWPLAVTAYNHGPAGMQRAVEAVGTRDFVEILRRYQGPGFGFASRNFYAELLAAIEIEREAERYYGPIERLRPFDLEAVELRGSVPFSVLARLAGVDGETLAEWNPSLTPRVTEGRAPAPQGFRLRLPRANRATFETRYAAWRKEREGQVQLARRQGSRKSRSQREPVAAVAQSSAKAKRTHRVKRGQTLTAIARMYGLSVAEIERENRLRRGARLRAGQVLIIPEG